MGDIVTAGDIAEAIRAAYDNSNGNQPGRMMSMVDLRQALGGVSEAQLTAGVLHLIVNERQFVALPESNQKALRQEERDAAVYIGNQARHWIGWL